MPKSLNVTKALQAAGVEEPPQGLGTALKPAWEPIVLARKPLSGTVAANVLQWGTGALNIDGCRVSGLADRPGTTPPSTGERNSMSGDLPRQLYDPHTAGRWPTNVVLDGDQADALDEQSGTSMSPAVVGRGRNSGGGLQQRASSWNGASSIVPGYGDSGGASRFFPVFRYQAKAPTRERVKVNKVAHPTVKPLALMRWLVRLVTPPGGTVLDPFAGSGTTVEAAMLEGFRCVAIEREADYLPLIDARIARARAVEPPAGDVPLFDAEPSAKPQGRWPTNVVMDRGQAAELDEQSGTVGAHPVGKAAGDYGYAQTTQVPNDRPFDYGDKGGASRFFPVFNHEPLTLWGDDEDTVPND